MKKFALILLNLLSLAAVAAPSPFTFMTNNGSITLTAYSGSGGAVVIPATTTNGLTVTSIGPNAFESASITSVSIPGSITNIGSGAFSFCRSLTNLTIPGSVLSLGTGAFEYSGLVTVTIANGVPAIGTNAFENCQYLTSVTIPESVTNVGDYAFDDCSDLAAITLPASVTSLGNDVFASCASLYSLYFMGNAPAVGSSVFYSDPKATVFALPGAAGWGSSLAGQTVLPFPFGCATNANAITITNYAGSAGTLAVPTSLYDLPVGSIGPGVFASNSLLTSVTIPGSITNIGTEAFAFCAKLKTIAVSAPATLYSSSSGLLFNQIQTTLIQFPGALGGQFAIPYGVTNIGPAAFAGSQITAVSIPTSVTSIGPGAFNECASLYNISVTPPNLFYSSVNGVLFNQNQTTLLQFPAGTAGSFSYTIPGTVTSIGAGAFQNCAGLISLVITNSVTNIGSQAFAGTKLTTILIPGSVTSLGDFAFAGCLSLTNVEFAGNAPAADATVFANDPNAAVYYLAGTTGWSSPFGGIPAVLWLPYNYATNGGAITISGYTGPGGAAILIPGAINGLPVTSIGSEAFAGAAFTSVTIPGSVTSLGSGCFINCSSLTSVTIPNSVTSIGPSAFQSCSSLTNITLGTGITSLTNFVFANCTSLTSITIPYTVTSLVGGTFQGCPALANVYFMGYSPMSSAAIFNGEYPTIYFFPGTGGWEASFFGVKEVQWTPYTYGTNAGEITFTGYSGPGNTAFIIPATINGLPVTSIGSGAFAGSSLTGLIIPGTVASLGENAFANSPNLGALYFTGNAPAADATMYSGDSTVTVYYLYGTTGWSSPWDGLPAELWLPYNFTTNAGSATITGYTGPLSAAINLPPVLGGLPVTSLGSGALENCAGLTGITIPGSVTNLGTYAFAFCDSLTSMTIPGSVLAIGYEAFDGCLDLTNVVIEDGVVSLGFNAFYDCPALTGVAISATVTNLGNGAFLDCHSLSAITVDPQNPAYSSLNGVLFDKNQDLLIQYPEGLAGNYVIPAKVNNLGTDAFFNCTGLSSVTLPGSVTNLGTAALAYCSSLANLYFLGNAPTVVSNTFSGTSHATAYYLPGTTGWSALLAGVPTAPWLPQIQTGDGSFGENGSQFGFNLTWATGQTVQVDACTNLASPVWSPVQTISLTNGTYYFSEPFQTTTPARFYRLSSP